MLRPGSAVVLRMTNGWSLKCYFSHELSLFFPQQCWDSCMSTGLSSTCSRLWSTWPFWVASHSWQATGCWLRKLWRGKEGSEHQWGGGHRVLLCVSDHCFGLLDLVCGTGLLSPTSLPLELSRAVRGCPQGAAPAERIGHVACAEWSSWNSVRLWKPL